jgi:hypothetical protein
MRATSFLDKWLFVPAQDDPRLGAQNSSRMTPVARSSLDGETICVSSQEPPRSLRSHYQPWEPPGTLLQLPADPANRKVCVRASCGPRAELLPGSLYVVVAQWDPRCCVKMGCVPRPW